jgi:hypothetical protein
MEITDNFKKVIKFISLGFMTKVTDFSIFSLNIDNMEEIKSVVLFINSMYKKIYNK